MPHPWDKGSASRAPGSGATTAPWTLLSPALGQYGRRLLKPKFIVCTPMQSWTHPPKMQWPLLSRTAKGKAPVFVEFVRARGARDTPL